MEVRVQVRFNKRTGEVEIFDVEESASGLPEGEHNREHDRIALELGRLLEQHPRITEITEASQRARGGAIHLPGTAATEDPQPGERIAERGRGQ